MRLRRTAPFDDGSLPLWFYWIAVPGWGWGCSPQHWPTVGSHVRCAPSAIVEPESRLLFDPRTQLILAAFTGEEAGLLTTGEGRGAGQQGSGYGRSGGSGALAAPATGEQAAEDWTVYEGTVTQAPAAGSDLVIETEDGEEIVVGTGPGYLAEQGFVLEAGDAVQVQGYWEDGELKAAQITRLQDGVTVQLRDQLGRPAWSGSGQRALSGQAAVGQGTVNGQGNLSVDEAGTGQAQVGEWLSLEGTASGVDSAAMVVMAGNGQEIVVDGRAWRYLLEQGFEAQAGDGLELVGFYENDAFEVGEVTNLSTGQRVLIRDESGRPLWAGRGRGV